MQSTQLSMWVIVVALFVVGLGLGFWLGASQGYAQGSKTGHQSGYEKALADTKATQEEIARKASEEAAKVANPFQTTNPLEGVEANPFEETAKKLNPFSE